ncbi:MAG: hypothetical protein SR1Q7_06260, partial [Quinella sp. 1Q7]|nr:hypothetical protein [Quinella sp. 1Q7]
MGSTIVGNVVTLGTANFTAGGVSVLGNSAAYAFSLTGGDYSGLTFYGLDTAADVVTVAGTSLAVNVGGGSNVVYGLNTSGYLTVTAGDGNDSIFANSYNTIDAGAGDDSIFAYSYNSIVAGDGNDSIFASGNNNVIDAGAGDDSIFAYSYNSIVAGDGNDSIYVNGINNTIDGGAGSNFITLTGATGNYIDVSDGTNSISLGTGVQSFTVSGFSADDTITFAGNVTALGSINGGMTVTAGSKTVTINGLDYSAELNDWTLNGGKAYYGPQTLAGGYSISGNAITYRDLELGGTLLELDGITSTDGFTVDSGNTIATLNAAGFSSTVTVLKNDKSLEFYLSGAVSSAVTFVGLSGVQDSILNEVASLTIDLSNGGDTDDDNVTNYGDYVSIVGGSALTASNEGDHVTIDGGDGDDIIQNDGGKYVIINGGAGDDNIDNNGGDNDSTGFVTINGGDGDDNITNSGDSAYINGGGGSNTIALNGGLNVTINVSEGNDLIGLDSFDQASFNVVGFGVGDTIGLSAAVTNFSVSGNTLTAGNVTVYGISAIATVKTGWDTPATSSIGYLQHTVAGAVLGGYSMTITYDSLDAYATLFTIDGLGASTGLSYFGTGTVVTVNGAALTDGVSGVTISGGDYTFVLGEGVVTPKADGSDAKWTLDGGKASYVLAGGTSGYKLSANKKVITFQTAGSGTPLLELDGITNIAGFSVAVSGDGNVATLNAAGFSSNVTVLSNSYDFALELVGTAAAGTTFNGMSTADVINNRVDGLTVNGLGGDDEITNYGANATIDGGLGDDIIDNYGVSAVINGGLGNDNISNDGASSLVDGGDGADEIENTGDFATVNGGLGNDTIRNDGVSAVINGGGGSNFINLQKGDYVFVNVTEGDDTINVDATSIDNFSVSGFSTGDVITFDDADITGLTTVDSGLVVTIGDDNVTIGGLSLYTIGNVWQPISGSNAIDYVAQTVAGALSSDDGKQLTFGVGSESNIFHIYGLSTETGLTTDDTLKVVTVTADALSGVTNDVTIIGSNYTFSLSGISTAQYTASGWYSAENDNTASLIGAWNTAGFSLSGDSTVIEFTSADGISDPRVVLSGISSTLGMAYDTSTITVVQSNFAGTSVSIISNREGFTFSLSGTFNANNIFYGGDALNDSIFAADSAKGITIDGLGGNDFIGGGLSTAVWLNGGSGADTFSFGGGNDTIADYHHSDSEVDKVSFGDGFTIDDIIAVSKFDGNTKLDFNTSGGSTATDTLTFMGISVADTVSVTDSGDWKFYGESNAILTGDGFGGIFLDSVDNFTFGASGLDTNYSDLNSVTLKAGGFVTAAGLSEGSVTMKAVGINDAIFEGGMSSSDYFFYAGGSMTIRSYKEDPDYITIGKGFSITGQSCPMGDDAVPNVTLWTANSDGVKGTILLEGVTNDNPHKTEIMVYYEDGGNERINLTGDIFNRTRKNAATEVTIAPAGKYRDFGIQTTTPSAQETIHTSEYFTNLTYIQADASTDNVHFIGNQNANTFYIAGGESNILTGGMGKDTFVFGSFSNSSGSAVYGGGIITDFGIGVVKNGSGSALATSPLEDGSTDNTVPYERNNPLSYAEGNDVLQINGKVVEIAFAGHGVASTKKKAAFTAYVTYDADGKDDTKDDKHTIMLANIAKTPTKTSATDSKQIFKTDDFSAGLLKISHNGGSGDNYSMITGSALTSLFRTTVSGGEGGTSYSPNIAALDAIINNSGNKYATDLFAAYGYAKDSNSSLASNGIYYTTVDSQSGGGGTTP